MLDQTQTPAEPLLQAIGITKLYGSFVANDHIDLDLHPAQIHALLGENGVGKSTFVKIAYGLRNPWRFTFLPTGQAMTEDTGSSYWEDLDTIQAGGNYGWPFKEGNCGSCGYAA